MHELYYGYVGYNRKNV
uniref:Uncharacterized protein n=1 Tax=Arundo donax TaxID=35708 RepID=A0A0A9APZ6_ARUDO